MCACTYFVIAVFHYPQWFHYHNGYERMKDISRKYRQRYRHGRLIFPLILIINYLHVFINNYVYAYINAFVQ